MLPVMEPILHSLAEGHQSWTFSLEAFEDEDGMVLYESDFSAGAEPVEGRLIYQELGEMIDTVPVVVEEYDKVIKDLDDSELAFAARARELRLDDPLMLMPVVDQILLDASTLASFDDIDVAVWLDVEHERACARTVLANPGRITAGVLLHIGPDALDAYSLIHETAHVIDDYAHPSGHRPPKELHPKRYRKTLKRLIAHLGQNDTILTIKQMLVAGNETLSVSRGGSEGGGVQIAIAERWSAVVGEDGSVEALWCRQGVDNWGTTSRCPGATAQYLEYVKATRDFSLSNWGQDQ